MSLVEIGPRFVLTPIRIFEGAFSGATVYSNPGLLILGDNTYQSLILSQLEFITPTAIRSEIKQKKGNKYRIRKEAEVESARRKELHKREEDALGVSKVFA